MGQLRMRNEVRYTRRVPRPISVYISYADSTQDRRFCEHLTMHLATLVRAQRIQIYQRDSVDYGEDQREALGRLVATADIFIPLLSAAYLADEIAHEVELVAALKQREQQTLSIWPVRVA